MIRVGDSFLETRALETQSFHGTISMKYEYTSLDIRNLFACYFDEKNVCHELKDPNRVFYQREGGVFVFPPVSSQENLSIDKVFAMCFTSFFEKFPVASEVLVPIHTGSHWVILQGTFIGKEVELHWIDSLSSQETDVIAKEFTDLVKPPFKSCGLDLKKQFDAQGNSSEIRIHSLKKHEDTASSGPIIVANIVDLFNRKEIQTTEAEEIEDRFLFQMRRAQLDLLSSKGMSLDSDPNSFPIQKGKRKISEETGLPSKIRRTSSYLQTKSGELERKGFCSEEDAEEGVVDWGDDMRNLFNREEEF